MADTSLKLCPTSDRKICTSAPRAGKCPHARSNSRLPRSSMKNRDATSNRRGNVPFHSCEIRSASCHVSDHHLIGTGNNLKYNSNVWTRHEEQHEKHEMKEARAVLDAKGANSGAQAEGLQTRAKEDSKIANTSHVLLGCEHRCFEIFTSE